MRIPFTVEQFFGVFAEYNAALWPAQVALVALAVGAIVLLLKPRRWSGTAISAILSFLWAWMALAYHLAFFSAINPLAYLFAGVSLAGSLGFAWHGVFRRRLQYRWSSGPRSVIGVALLAYALVVYPLWSVYLGHRYPAFPTFGLPCPTTIFTVGMLAFLVRPHPRSPYIAPVLWCIVGAQAAWFFGVHQDLALVIVAVLGLVWMAQAGARNEPSRL